MELPSPESVFVPFRGLVKILACKQPSVTPSLAVESSLRTLTGSVWFLLPPTVQHLPVLVWTCVYVCVCVTKSQHASSAQKPRHSSSESHKPLGPLDYDACGEAIVHISLYYGFGIETQNVNTVVRRIGRFDKLSFK